MVAVAGHPAPSSRRATGIAAPLFTITTGFTRPMRRAMRLKFVGLPSES